MKTKIVEQVVNSVLNYVFSHSVWEKWEEEDLRERERKKEVEKGTKRALRGKSERVYVKMVQVLCFDGLRPGV